MRIRIVIGTLLFSFLIINCKPNSEHHPQLTKSQWEDVFDTALNFINQILPDSISTNALDLYHKYDNENSRVSVYSFYLNGKQGLNYSLDQNVIQEIVERQNIEIESSLKNLPSTAVTFAKDTIDLKTNLFFISQPLLIKENLINIVFRLKQPKTNITRNWVFVYIKENILLTPIVIYDEQNDFFWELHDL
ncbi:hypothetical protein [Geofilum rubicundum]|uniref:hypothetical protein n=1 Tax=Geofilum rubicundum TaxID=472113 RepID=UPI00078460D8|nr:hypothetical protein [Geofilum rubicundum]